MERGLTKQQIISVLLRTAHGKLEDYSQVALEACVAEPEFYAHLVSYNQRTGQVRDSKLALPIVSLACQKFTDRVFAENSLAHVLLQPPRDILRALQFSKQFGAMPHREGLSLTGAIRKYLRELESNRGKFKRIVARHARTVKSLYALTHTKPNDLARMELWDGGEKGMRALVRQLESMDPVAAAAIILNQRIPFTTVVGAVKTHLRHPDVVLAIVEVMTPNELVSNMKTLERWGIKTNPALRGALDAALKRIAESKAPASQRATMKAERAAEALGDSDLAQKVRAAGEKAMDRISVEGDWAVLADRSPSMEQAIEKARLVADAISRLCKGKVHLVWFDGGLYKYMDVSGKTYEEIKELTRGMRAGGSGTSIGVGLQYLRERNIHVDGIAIVSDGGENGAPMFPHEYPRYCAFVGKEPPVYLYHVPGSSHDVLTGNMNTVGHPLTKFDASNADMYSLPDLVRTMRTNRFSLADEIMESRLLTLADVLG